MSEQKGRIINRCTITYEGKPVFVLEYTWGNVFSRIFMIALCVFNIVTTFDAFYKREYFWMIVGPILVVMTWWDAWRPLNR